MKWPAAAALTVLAAVAGYLNAKAVSAAYWWLLRDQLAEASPYGVPIHPTSPSLPVVGLLMVVGFGTVLVWVWLARRSQWMLQSRMFLTTSFVLFAAVLSMIAWADISSPPF